MLTKVSRVAHKYFQHILCNFACLISFTVSYCKYKISFTKQIALCTPYKLKNCSLSVDLLTVPHTSKRLTLKLKNFTMHGLHLKSCITVLRDEQKFIKLALQFIYSIVKPTTFRLASTRIVVNSSSRPISKQDH